MKVSDFDQLSDAEAIAHLKKVFEKQDYYDTFLVLISPSPNLAEKVLRLNMSRLMETNCNKRIASNSLVSILTELKSCLRTRFHSIKATHTLWGDHAEMMYAEGYSVDSVNSAVQALCKELKVAPEQCKSDLIPFFAMVKPAQGSPSLTYPQEFFRISTDPQLVKFSAEFTFYFIDLLLEAARLGHPGGKDLFSDVVTFFRKQGLSSEASRRLAFTFLGVYGVRGASFVMKSDYYSGNGNDFGNKYGFHPASLSAMAVLSVGMSYLDKLAHAEGRPYAVPRAYATDCHMGKPYHFWMAASLARYAKKQGFSDFVSYYGPVLSGIGYDFLSSGNGRDIDKLFEIKTPYDSYANMTRIDNWARALGAHFGRHNGKVLPLNANALLEAMFDKAELPSNPSAEDQLARIKAYNQIVRPIPLILKLSL
jgi:hypothetical protein